MPLQLQKNFSAQLLITLFLTFQISACNDKDIANDTTSSTSDIPDTAIGSDINLSWAAPSEREDSKPISLSEIAGYKVHYGTTQRKYSNSVDINDGSADGYTLKNFSAGTYYFALTTYDTAGRESQYSAEIKIVV